MSRTSRQRPLSLSLICALAASSCGSKFTDETPPPESFGPDGYLYIGLGDGGGANDPRGGSPCAVPADNPWSYGLRNPWRFSFDRATGDHDIGDGGLGEDSAGERYLLAVDGRVLEIVPR